MSGEKARRWTLEFDDVDGVVYADGPDLGALETVEVAEVSALREELRVSLCGGEGIDQLLRDLGLDPDPAARETVTEWVKQSAGG